MQSCKVMETHRDRKVLAAVCPNQISRRRRRAAVSSPSFLYIHTHADTHVVALVLNVLFCHQHKVVGPRSSSPVTVRMGLPCALKQGELRAFTRSRNYIPVEYVTHVDTLSVLQLFRRLRGMTWNAP